MANRITRREALRNLGGGLAVGLGAALAGCSRSATPEAGPNTPYDPNATDPRKYVCGKCGHVYDPAATDPPTPFPSLPDTWVCPRCGAPKSRFAPRP